MTALLWRKALVQMLAAFSLFETVFGKFEILKICVVGNPEVETTHATKYCYFLEMSKGTRVTCVYKPDRLQCLWAVSNGEADFSVFEPEDLYFSTLTDQKPILIMSEIKDLKEKRYRYGTVVVVRKAKNITSIGHLRGTKLCHPGLESGFEWPALIAQYLEERVAPQNCERGLTIYEDRIKATSEFFGSACKAGPWVIEPEEDARLKRKYWNLCSLCESGDCRVTEKYRGSGGSITCFGDGIGDVLWARYDQVKIHLASQEKASEEFAFLCDDGTTMAVSSSEPCIWLGKPWQVIAANGKSAKRVQQMLQLLKIPEISDWEKNLLHLIEIYLEYLENLPVPRTPEDYLRGFPGYLSASAMSEGNCKPKRSITWCLSSDVEHLKCTWMSQAAAALGIQPALECVQKLNFTECLNSVSKAETDVVVVPPDHLEDALRSFKLKTFLLETENHFNDSWLISAVVKKKSNIRKFEDLKGKKACFSRENGIGWNAAYSALRERSLVENSKCRSRESMLEFFGEVCVTTEDDALINGKRKGNLNICCSKASNAMEGEAKALDCLEKDACDVAFVDLGNGNGNSDNFKTICKWENSTDCHWAWSHASHLMMSHEACEIKAAESYGVFFQMGQYFGRNSRKNNAMLKIFGLFSGTSNILFRDTSATFSPVKSWNHANNYEEILSKMTLCSGSCSKKSQLIMILYFTFMGLTQWL